MAGERCREQLIEWVASNGYRHTGKANHRVLFHALHGREGDGATLYEKALVHRPGLSYRKFKRTFTDAGFSVKRTSRWNNGRAQNVYWLIGFR